DGYGNLSETRYAYMNGTSMATPFVSGMAGILTSYAPDVPFSKIKEAILNSADPVPGLSNKTVSGGRANLSAALKYLTKKPEPDQIPLSAGWNHISVAKRLIAGNDTASDLFGQITNTSGHSVLKYHNASWITAPADEKISPLSSYWVWTGENQHITPKLDPIQNGTYVKNLTCGWNGFGIIGTDLLSAKTHLIPIGDSWTYVIGFNASSQYYEEPIIRNGTGNQSDSRLLMPWQGYWLYTTDNVTYQVTI
ncbi:MAG TPA: S8 family serine peptidase, partial [Methanospirillum sp.]|nr:S8 family serine peptidase [Methanospirillum sp.]